MAIEVNGISAESCFYCGERISCANRYCTKCGNRNPNWKQPTRFQCGNCHNRINAEDKYCRICGSQEKEGVYEPENNLMQCIYGPMPEEREHVCEVCGYSWVTLLMVDSQKYCPQCGGKAPYKSMGRPFISRRL